LKTLLVHEWIESSGGAERVLDTLGSRFSDASIICLWDASGGRFPTGRVIESPLKSLKRHKAAALPLMPLAWAWLSKKERPYDRAIISSHLFAHHFGAGGNAERFIYVHTPARYLWTPEMDPRGQAKLVRLLAPMFRTYDRRGTSAKAAHYAANSHFVRARIQQHWGIDVPVIHPPVETERLRRVSDWSSRLVDTERSQLDALPDDFLLGASRFVRYKELDIVIEAGEDAGLSVVLAGDGPDHQRLLRRAREATVPVVFIKSPSDTLLYSLFQKATAYVFPPIEDFGIMPVEAMAVGAKVIVNAQGGAGESVEDGVSGTHWHRAEGEPFVSALRRSERVSGARARARAERFSSARFLKEVDEWLESAQS
jgi:glycosyltransferase involved in cell wall biosynthesis